MEQNDICIKDFKTLIVWLKARELAQELSPYNCVKREF